MNTKPLAIALITASAALLSACDHEKTFNDWGEPYPVLSGGCTIPVSSKPATLTGNYDIISFKREANENCISYANDSSANIPGCGVQSPVAPRAVRGKVMLSYDNETEGIYVTYKYDILDDGSYYAIHDKTDNLSSYVRDDNERAANLFPAFKVGEEIINGANRLLIDNFTATNESPVLPGVRLVTDNGSTTYTFALKKENDMSILYDTHTPINEDNVTEDFITEDPSTKEERPYMHEPVNLDPADGNKDPNVEVNGRFDPFGLFGYYKITGMKIYNAEEYIVNMDNATPVYDTDERNGTKFKGEFWIRQPADFLSQMFPPDNIINLSAYIKYQIDADPGIPLPEGVRNSILVPELLQIKLPLQNKDENGEVITDMPKMIAQTFNLLAQWDKNWPDRARKIVYKPLPVTFDSKDNKGSLLYLDENKKYAAELTLEQIYGKQYSDRDGTADNMLNFDSEPYW